MTDTEIQQVTAIFPTVKSFSNGKETPMMVEMLLLYANEIKKVS